MAVKMKNCKACGKEVAPSAKVCPSCGAKLKMGFGKKLLIGIGALIVLGIISSVSSGGNKTTTTNQSSVSTSQPKPAETKVENIKVSSKDLSDAYEANEVKADQTYKGKMAEITGTVQDIGVILDQTYVILSNDKDFSIIGVQCFFNDKAEIAKVADLKKGDKVTIVGKIDGKSINVAVKNSILK